MELNLGDRGYVRLIGSVGVYSVEEFDWHTDISMKPHGELYSPMSSVFMNGKEVPRYASGETHTTGHTEFMIRMTPTLISHDQGQD